MLSRITLATICVLALVFWPCADSMLGDTVKLTNGSAIHGKVVEQHPQSEKYLRIEFSNGGWMLISKQNVESITPDNTDQFEARRGSGGPEE